ncbi:hypothetical protein [Nodosilinea sp. E11]|uniref:hypothetical protein n=1 Tax=Nodosilinea sp. E11 TaxID=3037479 RepID=UPI002934198E|nr:hypothetical protein [Nodosilinea sp. E11]WOD37367.1 hypothetical protein RRF56_02620 [Nodosilinea sp. E11]WOD37929.1 hypothetical protein RRF56_17085 [Nodosilinea sp. E11]
MTAFNPATDLPASVNSLSKLVGWANGAFYQLHKATDYQESVGGILVPVVTAQDGLAANKTERIIFRVSLELEDTWRASPQPFWVNVRSISTAAIPTQYRP